MAIPFVNASVGKIYLAMNNKNEYLALLSFLDDLATKPTPNTLIVGNPNENYQYDYSGGGGFHFSVDGINPPTADLFRVVDQVTGTFYYLYVYNGVLTISPTL